MQTARTAIKIRIWDIDELQILAMTGELQARTGARTVTT